jgi:alpha-L-fucosidase
MSVNSESIYGTSASPFSSLEWGRCTMKYDGRNTLLYLHVFDWPENGILKVPDLKNKVRKAYFLSDRGKLSISRDNGEIKIKVPDDGPDSPDTVIVLLIKGLPELVAAPA